jgi:hypothetical protein
MGQVEAATMQGEGVAAAPSSGRLGVSNALRFSHRCADVMFLGLLLAASVCGHRAAFWCQRVAGYVPPCRI